MLSQFQSLILLFFHRENVGYSLLWSSRQRVMVIITCLLGRKYIMPRAYDYSLRINLYLPLESRINCLRELTCSLLFCPRKTQFCLSLHFRHAIITCNTHKRHAARAQTTALVSNTILPKLNSSEKEENKIKSNRF